MMQVNATTKKTTQFILSTIILFGVTAIDTFAAPGVKDITFQSLSDAIWGSASGFLSVLTAICFIAMLIGAAIVVIQALTAGQQVTKPALISFGVGFVGYMILKSLA